MSAQPIAPPEHDLEILQALDFEPDHACEAGLASSPCPNTAVYMIVVRKTCGCPAPVFAICTPCWDLLGQYRGCVHCSQCNSHVGRSRKEAFRIVCTIGSGS